MINEDILDDLNGLESGEPSEEMLSDLQEDGSNIQLIAPNLCELVGSLTASKLVSAAGGIKQLAATPACNIQLLGRERGFSKMQRKYARVFSQMELVKDTPKEFQMDLVRMLASNTFKCAKADMLKNPKGFGAGFREQMYKMLEKIQCRPSLHCIDKSLPASDLHPKKIRNCERYPKTEELYEMQEIKKQQNRLNFGEQQLVDRDVYSQAAQDHPIQSRAAKCFRQRLSGHIQFELSNCFVGYLTISNQRLYFRKHDEKVTISVLIDQYAKFHEGKKLKFQTQTLKIHPTMPLAYITSTPERIQVLQRILQNLIDQNDLMQYIQKPEQRKIAQDIVNAINKHNKKLQTDKNFKNHQCLK